MQGKGREHLSDHQGKSGTELKIPVVGLNDNLVFMGRQLHVQTEHTGFPVPRIVTQVFCSGRVLISKKTECPAGIHESQDFNALQKLMSTQHYQVLEEISAKQARIMSSH
jgi:hypothetical protein